MRWERETDKIHQYTTADGIPENSAATAFAEDLAGGGLWLGFYSGGVARFRNGRFQLFSARTGFPTGYVSAIYFDRKRRLWIATSNNGVIRFDNPAEDEPRYTVLNVSNGLSSNQANCITEDDFGRIYISTARGINRVEPATGRIRLYTQADGLPGNSIGRCARDRAGNLWFSQKFALARLIVQQDEQNSPPPVFIGSLRVNGEKTGKLSELGETSVGNLELASDERQVQIDFFALGFATGERLLYQYKLNNAEWSEPSAQRTINLNLSPGSYNFEVRAVNAEGAASENPARVSFSIARPIWQRWWFLTIISVLIGLVIYALYRYRIEQIIKLERVRTRIATDLHDDIGSSLSKIAILSEVVRQKNGIGGNGAEANGKNEPLDIIANTSREMIDSMSDIVWAINPERDNLSDLIQRMRRFAEDILDAQDIGYQFIVPEHLRELALGADVRRDVYLIFKECVNNLAKYAEASEAVIKVKFDANHLLIEIADNGRGFDAEQKLNGGAASGFGGNGLKNMRRRAENFGGAIEIESAIGAGTRIVLRIPVERKLFAV
jgi:signal transduction histidine kinase